MSVQKLRAMKGREKIAMLTAYDYLTARILSEAGVDMILVGDSLGMVYRGYPTTLPVTLDQLIYHASAVRAGAPNAFVVADLPFLSYGVHPDESVRNAGRVLKESGANAVKLEGGANLAGTVRAMTDIGIPVMGHIGLKPQSVHKDGHRIAGRTEEDLKILLEDARAIEKAGAFAIVIEGTAAESARAVTETVSVPTIGIGAGNGTDGQVLVVTDMLGLQKDADFRHNKKYADLHGAVLKAVSEFVSEVKSGAFPTENQTFHRQ